jgi:intron-binding protein aquarius
VGYLRDIRRMTVALSRARLGMYILGRREIFEGCFELKQAFDILLQRPDKLALVTGELWPSQRRLADDANETVPGEAVMEGVEHLGQYVYEMAQTKMEQLRAEKGLPSAEAEVMTLEQMDVTEIEPIPEEDEEDAEDGVGPAEGFEAEEA